MSPTFPVQKFREIVQVLVPPERVVLPVGEIAAALEAYEATAFRVSELEERRDVLLETNTREVQRRREAEARADAERAANIEKAERLGRALAEVERLRNRCSAEEFWVNCDGMYTDGSFPNTPHPPIGTKRRERCPACAALQELDSTKASLTAALSSESLKWRRAVAAEDEVSRLRDESSAALARAEQQGKEILAVQRALTEAGVPEQLPPFQVPLAPAIYRVWFLRETVAVAQRLMASDYRLGRLAREIDEWAKATFPGTNERSKAEHLRREAEELAANPTDVEEMADVFILLANLTGYLGIDLAVAVEAKMAKNRKRKWGAPDAQGVVEHVRDFDPEVPEEAGP